MAYLYGVSGPFWYAAGASWYVLRVALCGACAFFSFSLRHDGGGSVAVRCSVVVWREGRPAL